MTDRGLKIKESPDDADLTFPNWHHPNIIQGLKKKTIAVTGRYVAPTDIFQPTLHSIFYKRCPIIFLYDRGSFFVRCRLQKLQCGLARFPRARRTEVVFRPTLACSHLVGQENISPPRKKKKTWFTDIDRKKDSMTSVRKDDRSRSKKEESADDADGPFPNRHHPNIIEGLNRKNNSGHWSLNSPD